MGFFVQKLAFQNLACRVHVPVMELLVRDIYDFVIELHDHGIQLFDLFGLVFEPLLRPQQLYFILVLHSFYFRIFLSLIPN